MLGVIYKMDFIAVGEAAKKWGISERRVQKLCEENKIAGVVRFGHSWAIPKSASKPNDARFKKHRGTAGKQV